MPVMPCDFFLRASSIKANPATALWIPFLSFDSFDFFNLDIIFWNESIIG
jgi:hypothetical protein